MELPHIGQHCSLKECNRLDFLPITCDACDQVFCVDHYKYETHQCDTAKSRDVQVPVCPLCMQPVGIKRDQLPDVAVSEHMDKNCKRNDPIKRTNPSASDKTSLQKCSFKSCKQKDIIYLECQDCGTKYCIKHRHPSDHSCPGPTARSISSNVADNWNSFRGSCSTSASTSVDSMRNKAQQLSRYGRAALDRITGLSARNASAGPTLPASSSGDRQTITNLQGNLSEQEALAIALGESMVTTNSAEKPPTKSASTDGGVDVSLDAELARAIYESEIEAQQQQRNAANGEHQKGNCVLS